MICTCITAFERTDDPKRLHLIVLVFDPKCDHVFHRLAASRDIQ